MAYPVVEWIKQQALMNTTANDQFPAIAADSSGNVYFTYYTNGILSGGTFRGSTDIAVIKMDINGNIVWIREQSVMNTTLGDILPAIAVDSSGNSYVSYTTAGAVSGGILSTANDIVLFKLDTNGNVVWVRQQAIMNTSGNETESSIALDPSGNVYVTYHTSGTVSGGTLLSSFDVAVFKMDANGNLVWIKQHAVTNTTSSDAFPSIAVDSSGNSYVSYLTTGTVSGGTWRWDNDSVVFKLDTNGNVVWVKQNAFQNTTGGDHFNTIAVDSSGNAYVSYTSSGTASGGVLNVSQDIIVYKLDTNGNLVWIKQQTTMNSNGSDQNPVIKVDSAGNSYVTYYTSGIVSGGLNRGSNDIVVFKLDTNGNIVWVREEPLMNTTGNDLEPKMALDASGNIYISYYTTASVSGGTFLGSNDIVVMKITQTNSMNPPSISSVNNSVYNNTAVNVSWLSKNNADTIKVYRDSQVSGATKILLATVSGYSYDDYNVVPGTTYYYFVSGMFGSTETSLSSAVLFVYTPPSISLTWIKQTNVMNTNQFDQVPSISIDSSGNAYVAYNTLGTVSGGDAVSAWDIVVLKLDKNGNIVWVRQRRTFNTPSSDRFPSLTTDSTGNVYVAYQSDGTVSGGTLRGSNDIVVFKMDTNGNTVWTRERSVMNTTSNDTYPTISVDSSQNVYVSYMTTGVVSGGTLRGTSDIVVFKLDANGSVAWVRESSLMNTSLADQSPSISIDSSGNSYVSYFANGTVSGGTTLSGTIDIVVFKMDTDGNIVWIKQQAAWNTLDNDLYPSTAVDISGNVYVTYQSGATVSGGIVLGGPYDTIVFKLDTTGNTVWIRQLARMNTTGNDQFPRIAVDSTGNVFVTYQTNGTVSGGSNIGSNDIVFYKLDTNGNIVWIKEEPNLNTTGDDTSPAIAVDSTGENVYLAYQTAGTVSGGLFMGGTFDVVVAKYSATGSVPGAPTAVSAVAGNAQAVVSFTAPANNGGSDITSYTVTSSPGNITASGAASPITVTGLTNGTAYTFTVRATNSVGLGTASSPSNSITPSSPPSAPSGVTATAKSLSALVSWTQPANGGSAITSYTITPYQGASPVSASITTVQGAANTSGYVYGLANGTAYTFTVTATNAIGTSSASAASSSITPVSDAPTTAVTEGPTAITEYVASAPATTQTEQADLSISMRVSLNAGTSGSTTQQKVDAKVAYIDSMRAKVGAASFTIPEAKFTEFLATLITRTTDTLTPKPITAYVPQFTAQTATVDVSSASSTNYVQFEVPIGYTVVLQNGAATLSLVYNGTNFSDGTNTYNAGSIIVLGTKTLTLVGIGSGIVNVQDTSQIVCITKGSMVQTPVGNERVESLGVGDKVVTGDGRIVPITSMKQIVVVAANEQNAPYVIEKDAFGKNCPPNRLEVSPRHAIQLPSGLWEIPREASKDNKRVYQNKAVIGKQVVYYHFALPNYETDTAIVNGQITETLNDGKCVESYGWNEEKKGYMRFIKHVGTDQKLTKK